MSDTGDSRGKGEKVRNLTDAIRRVRTAEAERSDVVVEIRDAERARLEMLADELKGVFADVPAENEQFVFTVGQGTPPRLWIDLTSFVVMARDRRTYRFLKDTRLGRTVIVESDELNHVGDIVTDYVAERIIERERAVEGEWVIRKSRRDESSRREARHAVAERAMAEPIATPAIPAPALSPAMLERRALGWLVAAFLAGILLGVIVLLAYAWVTVPVG